MNSDIIVIGSGISALTSAAILAKQGHNVLILEKERRPGGALKRFKRKRIPFDVGFHYTGSLGKGEILNNILSYCGVINHLNISKFPDSGSDKLYIKGAPKIIDAFFSYEMIQEELLALFPKEKKAVTEYFSIIRTICTDNPFYNFELPLLDFLRDYRTSDLSLLKYIQSITDDPYLQAVFSYPSVLYGIPTDSVSLDIHAMVAHAYYSGAYTIDNGGQSIVDGFLKAFSKLNVNLATSQEVQSISNDTDGNHIIRTTDGNRYQCKQCIFTGHPSHFIEMVEENIFRPAYRKRLQNLKNSLSMNILFGSISSGHEFLEWNNHFHLPAGPNPFDKKFNHISKRVIMLTSTERKSFALPPNSKSVILLQPALWDDVAQFHTLTKGARSSSYEDHKKKVGTSMVERAYEQWGNMINDIQIHALGTPLTLRDELTTPKGCAYGAMHSLEQYTPDVRTRIPGLYLSGQSTLMTGVAGSAISGMVTAGHIIGLDFLWEDIRSCN